MTVFLTRQNFNINQPNNTRPFLLRLSILVFYSNVLESLRTLSYQKPTLSGSGKNCELGERKTHSSALYTTKPCHYTPSPNALMKSHHIAWSESIWGVDSSRVMRFLALMKGLMLFLILQIWHLFMNSNL